jgi:hypothetical protein
VTALTFFLATSERFFQGTCTRLGSPLQTGSQSLSGFTRTPFGISFRSARSIGETSSFGNSGSFHVNGSDGAPRCIGARLESDRSDPPITTISASFPVAAIQPLTPVRRPQHLHRRPTHCASTVNVNAATSEAPNPTTGGRPFHKF